MKFHPTPLAGAYTIELERRGDDRGFFARAFCVREFDALGLDRSLVQVNDSFSRVPGTLRGLHHQIAPRAETKLVRCIRGALWDVILDLRAGSPTFGRWFAAELSAENRLAMLVPRGCAHGFLTLQPETEAFYFATEFYSPAHERIVRWDDPRFAIAWPAPPAVLSDKDRAAPDFDPAHHRA